MNELSKASQLIARINAFIHKRKKSILTPPQYQAAMNYCNELQSMGGYWRDYSAFLRKDLYSMRSIAH